MKGLRRLKSITTRPLVLLPIRKNLRGGGGVFLLSGLLLGRRLRGCNRVVMVFWFFILIWMKKFGKSKKFVTFYMKATTKSR